MRTMLLLVSGLVLLPGCVFVDITVPLDTDLAETTLGSKVGKSSFQSILGLVSWGDAGTQAAAADGNLETIRHADQEVFLILAGLYYRHTTVVYGD